MTDIERARRFAKPYRVDDGRKFRLKNFDPGDRGDLTSEDKPRAIEALALGTKAIAELQDRLYAQDRWAVLLVFQAIDAAGKDGAIKHVMSGVNPQGCQVYSFKSPSSEDLDHDYLWRCYKALPERGRIGVFNRSYYEEIVVVRVRPEYLAHQKVPPQLLKTKNLWKERARDIRHFEDYLSRNGTLVRKFFLHVSKKEQEKRFRERLDKPEKNWKFSAADLEGTRTLGRLSGSLRGHDSVDRDAGSALVRGTGRQQMVHARGRGRRDCRRPRRTEAGVSEGLRDPGA